MDCERLYGVVQTVSQVAPPSYDRMEVILTAVAVAVAALAALFTIAAFMLGIFAFYGKREFLELAKKTAQGAATEWIEKNLTPEGMYAEYIRRNKPPDNAPPEAPPALEASDEENVPQPTTDTPVEPEPQMPVTQPYPREEEPDVLQAEPAPAEHQGDEPDDSKQTPPA